jgi:FkbM family methyltransferase
MDFLSLARALDNRVNSVLDIGAHVGAFSGSIRLILPNASIHMIEPNPLCEDALKMVPNSSYTMCLLSDKEEEKIYLMNKENLLSTGNSYYRELTEHFSDQNLVRVAMQSFTLDGLFPGKRFDFIKLDTQGSEIDIMRGGRRLISEAKFVLIECSVQTYNEGSPLVNEVIGEMRGLGFSIHSLIGSHVHDGRLMQQDYLFSKTQGVSTI